MNDSKLKLIVSQAVALDREIAEKQEKLKALKAILAAEAESRQDEATPTEGGGSTVVFEGADGCVCRVTSTGRSLKSAIGAESPQWRKIQDVLDSAGFSSARFFTPVVDYKPQENFRATIASVMRPADANKLIKLCENAGKTTVSFETKEAS
jgi:hypothetical protein